MPLPEDDPNDITATAFPSGAPADLVTLRDDPTLGDGHYTSPPFLAWQYALLIDGSQVFYDLGYQVWVSGAAPPAMPFDGEVVADLATLKRMLGAVSSADDANLSMALSAATEWVYERTMQCDWTHPDVQLAVLLLASRLYGRRRSPEGVAGFGGEGLVVRVLASDPDITRLMERHLELLTAGIG